ncbi:MAG: M1 family metallopeptidase [Micropruina sp.]|uniref:M1 family metallopeptidase n=1 Tax=Micropruina sp. TaxID=2737536 RepID=UPI0039E2BCAC
MSLTQRFWLVLTAVLVVTVLVLATLGDRLSGVRTPSPASTTTPDGLVRGAPGMGDPYLPEAGGGGYDVQHYDVTVDATLLARELRGSATVTAVARQDLDEFHLDLLLRVGRVSVNGVPARFTQSRDDLAITATRTDPGRPAIASGAAFTVAVDYEGSPEGASLPGTPAYYRTGEDFLIAGEPRAASLWFPVNDHPRDAATMRFAVRVPRGVEAICAGRLTGRGPDPDHPGADRWVWQVDAPTVSYATFLAVGQYRVEQGRTDGRPFVYSVSTRLTAAEQTRALRWLRKTPAAIRKLETHLGPYPFSGMGGFVPSAELNWGGLEVAMNPVYDPRAVGTESLLNHELAHMWFGDTVTLAEWNDMFNNESLTSYAEWLVTTGSSPAVNFDEYYFGSARSDRFWRPALSDPGLNELFVRVYDRGPTVVHALRNRMGDSTFFPFFRSWAQQHGPRSLEDFRRAADEATPEDLTGFFAEWLDQTDRPEPTAENGVPKR